MFKVGERYSRADVQRALDVPVAQRRGNWETGYNQYDGRFYIFCNVGTSGRTGHAYDNHWDQGELVWFAKNRTSLKQPEIQRLLSGDYPVHVFARENNALPFIYHGKGQATAAEDTQPVQIRWRFSSAVVDRTTIERELAGAGFNLAEPGAYVRKASRDDLTVYIKQSSGTHMLVVPPAFEDRISDLVAVGAERPGRRFFYHNSGMRSFPQRVNGGNSIIPFGIDFGFSTVGALRNFISSIINYRPPRPILVEDDDMSSDPVTETEAMRAARLGQQKFRQSLLDRDDGRCVLTEIEMPEILRASHIVPWREATPKERHDPSNGLLLAIHIDGLFDRGLISFSDDGSIIVSEKVSRRTAAKFGLTPTMKARIDGGCLKYLQRHRERYFPGST